MRQGLDWSRLSYALLRARSGSRSETSPTMRRWPRSPPKTAWTERPLLAATEDEAVKAEYQANTDEAMAIGVFGAPAYVFDGELFWGQDRLQMLEWRLTQKLGPPAARRRTAEWDRRRSGGPGYGLFGYWPQERAPCPNFSSHSSRVTGPRLITLASR